MALMSDFLAAWHQNAFMFNARPANNCGLRRVEEIVFDLAGGAAGGLSGWPMAENDYHVYLASLFIKSRRIDGSWQRDKRRSELSPAQKSPGANRGYQLGTRRWRPSHGTPYVMAGVVL